MKGPRPTGRPAVCGVFFWNASQDPPVPTTLCTLTWRPGSFGPLERGPRTAEEGQKIVQICLKEECEPGDSWSRLTLVSFPGWTWGLFTWEFQRLSTWLHTGLTWELQERCCLHPGPCSLTQGGELGIRIFQRPPDGPGGPPRWCTAALMGGTLQGFTAVLSWKEGAPHDLSTYPVGRNGYCFKILVHCFYTIHIFQPISIEIGNWV